MVNSSGLTIQWLASVSFLFSKMSKPNVEPTQPELFRQEYSSQYIQLSTHLHLVPAVKMGSYTSIPLYTLVACRGVTLPCTAYLFSVFC
jgi:hypothetical protein